MDLGIEVELHSPDDFLKIKETLTRIGVTSNKEKTLYQSCHILHKKGKYYILHFKEMFSLDGKPSNLDENDLGRRNTITDLLEQWGLLQILHPESIVDNKVPIKFIKILSFKEKDQYKLVPKYTIGVKKTPISN